MTAWIPKEQSPLAPGLYWCCIHAVIATDRNGVRQVVYRDAGHLKFDGERWNSDEFTHYLAEQIQ